MTPARGRNARWFALLAAAMWPGPLEASPSSVDLGPLAKTLKGDVRLIWMGDSYCSVFANRVPTASLNTWPIPRITAVQGGAGRNHALIRALKRCEPLELVQSSDPQGYRVERGSKSASYFGLPVRGMQELRTSSTLALGSDDEVLEFRMANDLLSNGVHGEFSRAGDRLRMRFLFRATSNPKDQIPNIRLQDHTGLRTFMDLMGSSRGFLHHGEPPTTGRPPRSRPDQCGAPGHRRRQRSRAPQPCGPIDRTVPDRYGPVPGCRRSDLLPDRGR